MFYVVFLAIFHLIQNLSGKTDDLVPILQNLQLWEDFFTGEPNKKMEGEPKPLNTTSGSIYVTNSLFNGIYSNGTGGVIYFYSKQNNQDKFLIEYTTISHCRANYSDGAFFILNCHTAIQFLCLYNCTADKATQVQCNTINNGAADGSSTGLTLVLIESCVAGVNYPSNAMVSTYLSNDLNITLLNHSNNHANQGAMSYIYSLINASVNFCSFTDNIAESLYNFWLGIPSSCPIFFTKCNIINNEQTQGSLLYTWTEVTFQDCCIIENEGNLVTGQEPYFVNCSTDIISGFNSTGDSPATATTSFIHQFIFSSTGLCNFPFPGIPKAPIVKTMHHSTLLQKSIYFTILSDIHIETLHSLKGKK